MEARWKAWKPGKGWDHHTRDAVERDKSHPVWGGERRLDRRHAVLTRTSLAVDVLYVPRGNWDRGSVQGRHVVEILLYSVAFSLCKAGKKRLNLEAGG